MKCIVNLLDQTQLNFEKFEQGKYSSSSAELSTLWKTQKLGFHMEILRPGTFSCPYHLHHYEEELFIAFKGSAMVRQDNEFFEMKEGDLIVFKAGVAHQFYNHTQLPFQFLALSNKDPNEICEYPDSNKTWDRQQKKLFQNGVEVKDYWKDEENPDHFWPENLISK
ncbi:MAG: cupin domain-containing protein [Bacteriovorax sp.]|nr:cupin domain-containing protein [Bacteriovorax sp.]